MTAYSLDRTLNIARYYYPALKRQIILYPIVGLTIGILNLVSSVSVGGLLFSGFINTIVSFLYIFGPVVFARHSSPVIETMLPATAREKASFIIAYSLIGTAILAFLPYYLVLWIGQLSGINTTLDKMVSLAGRPLWAIYLSSSIQNMVPAITCLYVVMRVRHNRALLGMVWSVVSMIGLGIVGAAWGVYMAISEHFSVGTCGEIDPDLVADSITSSLGSLVITVCTVSVTYLLLMIWLTYRQIAKRQI